MAVTFWNLKRPAPDPVDEDQGQESVRGAHGEEIEQDRDEGEHNERKATKSRMS